MESKTIPDALTVRNELHRIVTGPQFKNADRLARFLTFVVEEQLEGRGSLLKESLIGVEAFGKEPGYDPKADAIVRIQARRLRAKLEAWYTEDGKQSAVRISLPKGGYAPEFHWAEKDKGAPPPPAASRRIWILVSVAVIIGIAAVVASRQQPPKENPTGSRILTAYRGYQANPSFSPDGSTVAFDWGGPDGDNGDIYIQKWNADTPRRLTTSPARERNPVWLPDGKHVGFLRDTAPGQFSIIVVPVDGAGEQVITELRGDSAIPPRIEWSRDATKIYTSEPAAADEPSRVEEINLTTGARREVVAPVSRGQAAGTPGDDQVALSPDGRWVAFRRRTASVVADVFVAPADGSGAARAITHDRTGINGLAWSQDGKSLIVSSRRQSSLLRLWRFPLEGGAPECLTDATISATFPAVSPRDGQIAYALRYLDANVWRIDLTGKSAPQRLIASSLLDSSAQYSPDGQKIAFRSNRTGTDEIWLADSNGQSATKLTSFGGPVTGSPRWSPDGKSLVFDSRPDGSADIFVIEASGGQPRKFTAQASNEVTPSFSADGRFVYFASDRSGSWQVWKQPADGSGPAVQVTTQGGFSTRESADGQWLYYSKLNVDGLYRRPVSGGPESKILDALVPTMWGGWFTTNDRVVYAAPPASVQILDFTRRETRTAATLAFPPLSWDGALTVSPDGRFALVTEMEREGSELHLRPAK